VGKRRARAAVIAVLATTVAIAIAAPAALAISEGPVGDPTCADGEDNDSDGTIDGADLDCQNPSVVLRGQWHLDETTGPFADSSGNAFTGAQVGSPVSVADGRCASRPRTTGSTRAITRLCSRRT
jgi:hypothetical protein